MKKRLPFYLLLNIILFWGFIQPAHSLKAETRIIAVTPDRASELIAGNRKAAGLVILDIRTPREYQSGHIRGAVLINFYSNRFADELNRLDKRRTYLVHCRSGNRSGKSMALFKKLKFQKIYHLSSGIIGWNARRLPLVK